MLHWFLTQMAKCVCTWVWWEVGGVDREREGETDRERDGETEIERERQRETERDTERDTERERRGEEVDARKACLIFKWRRKLSFFSFTMNYERLSSLLINVLEVWSPITCCSCFVFLTYSVLFVILRSTSKSLESEVVIDLIIIGPTSFHFKKLYQKLDP